MMSESCVTPYTSNHDAGIVIPYALIRVARSCQCTIRILKNSLQCPNICYLNRMMKLVITLSRKPLQFFIMWLLVADKDLLDYYLLTGIYL